MLLKEFDGLEPKPDYIMQMYQYELPEEYQMEYMIHKVAKTVPEQDYIWNMPYLDFVKQLMFSRFDSYVMENYKDNARSS